MTVLALLTRNRRPRPWTRLTRKQLEAAIGHERDAKDRAIGRERARREQVGRWLDQASNAHLADAAHLDKAVTVKTAKTEPLTAREHRAVAHAIADVLNDFERGE